jgi:hypothetical protein
MRSGLSPMIAAIRALKSSVVSTGRFMVQSSRTTGARELCTIAAGTANTETGRHLAGSSASGDLRFANR